MTTYQAVPLDKSYLLLNHGPTVLISSAHQAKRNIMAAAWSSAIDFAPPKLMVILDKQGYSHELITASGEFVVMVPSKAIAKQVLQVGSSSGREVDKFTAFNLSTQPAKTVAAPVIDSCIAYLECKLIHEPHNQATYDLYIGEVTYAAADPRVFSNGRWHINEDALRSIHYQAGGDFFAIGESFHIDK